MRSARPTGSDVMESAHLLIWSVISSFWSLVGVVVCSTPRTGTSPRPERCR